VDNINLTVTARKLQSSLNMTFYMRHEADGLLVEDNLEGGGTVFLRNVSR
jgi:hypothetical protein